MSQSGESSLDTVKRITQDTDIKNLTIKATEVKKESDKFETKQCSVVKMVPCKKQESPEQLFTLSPDKAGEITETEDLMLA